MNLNELRECVEVLELMASSTSREKRMNEVERLTDEYIAHTGRVPDSDLLHRMTQVVLHEELTDKRADKMTLEEYPILSDSQYERRTSGMQRHTRKDGSVIREVPITQARNIGTDGKDYSLPQRRFT